MMMIMNMIIIVVMMIMIVIIMNKVIMKIASLLAHDVTCYDDDHRDDHDYDCADK